uniref:NADH-ubiquinone oxidoreductase chain 5 n=1 Tax=Chloroparvula japonica TaxID=1411623 RepID=A0A4D6C520_9CHLO|nr:NADH dehydrogenase subunit 5 [Chloroparvula japonica]QBX98774.1 NADH dehydrogenase subunit 5 [Chloroparvula japonica]
MYLSLVCLPLFGSLCTLGFGRYLGFRGAVLLTTACTGTSFILSCIAFYEVALCGSPCNIELAPWFVSELFDAYWGFVFDSLTVVMLVVVTSVSTLVHMYSISYMEGDPHLPRFMSYLSIFTFFMLMLVTGDNFIQLFLGWEGVGLASYLLINFWYTRLQANKSAVKAMLMNRVGDFGLALGIMGIFMMFKTVDYATVFALAPYYKDMSFVFLGIEVPLLTTVCILLFIGSVGKSAQLGLHTWLPDAMEGPTPVSALIHAATMVTAGVFLVARCSPLFEYAPDALAVVTCVGAMTAFFAATTGLVQNDLKRVIAYSTCSQLGYMVFACGLSNYSVGVFHLANHAFFKALLFLSAGCVIHAVSDEQDMRKMGGLVKLLPFTYAHMLIGSLALVGFPFLTGFYSKDAILEVAYARYSMSAEFAYILGCASAFCTSYYSFRLLVLTFLAPSNGPKFSMKSIHESPLLMSLPLVLLGFGSIFAGYMGKDMMIGLGTGFWGNALYTLPQNTLMVESEYIPQTIKLLPLGLTLSGAGLAFVLNLYTPRFSYNLATSTYGRSLYTFFNKRWLFDKVYNDYIGTSALNFGYNISFKSVDKGILELLGPLGIVKVVQELVTQVKSLQTGYVYHYAFIMLCGLTFMLALVGLWDILSVWVDNRLYFIHVLSFLIYQAHCSDL